MRKNQNTVTFRFSTTDHNLRQALQNYFDAHPKQSRNNLLRILIANGLAVANGQYHDRELNRIVIQLQNLANHLDLNNEKMEQIIKGQSDLQDAVTGQLTDADALITPTTQRQARHLNQQNRQAHPQTNANSHQPGGGSRG